MQRLHGVRTVTAAPRAVEKDTQIGANVLAGLSSWPLMRDCKSVFRLVRSSGPRCSWSQSSGSTGSVNKVLSLYSTQGI